MPDAPRVAGAPSAERILARCEALARFSEQPDGLTRVYLSPEHRAAADAVMGWMREAGMTARMDAVGNVIGRYEGSRPGLPCLMVGSHLDSVRDAGKYDGPLGILTAIECVDVLCRRGQRLPFAVEALAFADEEGVRFQSTLIGSRAVAGTLPVAVLDARDDQGVTMAEAMRAFGLDPDRIGEARRRPDDVLAYLELHIEQGPVLEAEGLPVGVVTAINGANRLLVEIAGVAGHAGTVPMRLRRDALAATAEAVLAVERRCREGGDLVGTVGRIAAEPGAVNVVPGRARFTIDLRAPDDAMRLAARGDIEDALREIAARRGVTVAVTPTHENACCACAPWLMEQLAAAIHGRGVPVRRLPSGAGHDAMAIQPLTDVAMLFVRCAKGISHNPAEAVDRADVQVGADVLFDVIANFRPKDPA